MENHKSILEKITATMKDIANIASDAANHALNAEDLPAKAAKRAAKRVRLAARTTAKKTGKKPAGKAARGIRNRH